jgi:PII-like signaling protein
VDEDCVKLSVYSAERRRTADGFVSDALLGLYERHRIATSVVLRGIGGFGTGRHLRTDASLTLSEDPPVVVVAVDTREAIEAVLDPVLAVKQRGLLTLERARLLHDGRDEPGPLDLPDDLHEAVKLTVYVGRKERVNGMPAYIAICDLMYRRQLAGASVFLGVDGTAHGQRQRAAFFGRNPDVPMMIIAVGSGERIGRVLPELSALLRRPMITLERVRVCKRDGELLEPPHALPGTDEHGLPLWQKLMVYTSETAHHNRVPIHRGLVQQLRKRKVPDGATVLRGVWGFHGDHRPHGDKLLSLSRHVPVVTIIIDTPANIAECFDVVDELTRHEGLVTSEMVPALVSDEGDGDGRPPMARHRY